MKEVIIRPDGTSGTIILIMSTCTPLLSCLTNTSEPVFSHRCLTHARNFLLSDYLDSQLPRGFNEASFSSNSPIIGAVVV